MSQFLDNLKGLAPEELERTKEMLDSDEAFASQFKSELDNLDAAGYAEAESLMFGQPVDTGSVPQGQQVQAGREEIDNSKLGNYIGSSLEDAAVALGQAVPFIEEIQGAVGTGIDVIAGDERPASEIYQENLKFARQDVAMRQERSPIASATGRIVGEVGTAGLVAGKAIKGLKAVTNMQKLGVNVGADILTETVQRFSDSERRTFEDLSQSAETAALFSIGGAAVGSALGKTFGAIKNTAGKRLENVMLSRGIEKVTQRVDAFIESTAGRISRQDYVDVLNNNPMISAAVKEGNVHSAQRAIPKAVSMLKSQKQSIIVEAEQSLGNMFGVTGKSVSSMSKSLTQPLQEVINREAARPGSVGSIVDEMTPLANDIENIFKAVSPETGLMEVPALRVSDMDFKLVELDTLLKGKKDLLERARKSGVNINAEDMLGKLRNLRNSVRDASFEGVDPVLKARLGGLKQIDKSLEVLGHANMVSEESLSAMRKIEDGKVSAALIQAATDMRKDVASIGAVGAIAGAVTGVGYVPAFVGAAVGSFAKNLSSAPALIGKVKTALDKADVLERQVDRLAGLGDFYLNGSGGRSKYYGSLMSRLSTAVANEDERTDNIVNAMEASQNLLKSPLMRNTDDFIGKKSAVMDILKLEDFRLHDDLQKTLDENGDIGPIMEQVSKIPAAKELMQDGVGWDGIVHDPEHKAQLEENIANQPLISGTDKVKMISALRQFGTMPNLEEVPTRQPKKYKPRKKGRPY